MARSLEVVPIWPPPIPNTLVLGDFTLDLEAVQHEGWNDATEAFEGVSGSAWLRFNCSGRRLPSFHPRVRPGVPVHQLMLEVVTRVSNPQTQISVDEAVQIDAAAEAGKTLTLDLALHTSELQEAMTTSGGLLEWIAQKEPKGGVLVEFERVAIRRDPDRPGIGVIDGDAIYPARPIVPTALEVTIAGFTLTILSLNLTPRGASGHVVVRLPGGITAVDSCQTATIDLGVVRITPTCEFIVTEPTAHFGPWMLADTGLDIEGTGYALDLRAANPVLGRPTATGSLLLSSGSATGLQHVPEPCNTGYLRGEYGFTNALLTSAGLVSMLTLQRPCTFTTLNPLGHSMTLAGGWLHVDASQVVAGEFGSGDIALPTVAVCEGMPGAQSVTAITHLSVQPDLSLTGTVDSGGREISWGELTHVGKEAISWTGFVREGFVVLPGDAVASVQPDAGGSFIAPTLSWWSVDASLAELLTRRLSGVTFGPSFEAYAFSPDRPGGSGNPFKLVHLQGWLRVGIDGVDGELDTFYELSKEPLGEPARSGYVGVDSFDADLFANDKRNLVAQFVSSAVYDSDFAGRFRIPAPCDIRSLTFDHMQITSTGHLVGGDIELPSAGVPLDHWQIPLVPNSTTAPAGVVSVRTGRIVFTAAGLEEAVHFAKPFGLTWGEMLASGDLGELCLDFNSYGQRFDKMRYDPHRMMLSKWVAGAAPNPYLATYGSVQIAFFGIRYINVRDAVSTKTGAPHFGRDVIVPKAGLDAGWLSTDLQLQGSWVDIVRAQLATFDCQDANVDYDVVNQDGFVGTGGAEFGFLHSSPLEITVEMHGTVTDIHIASVVAHDLYFSLGSRIGAMSHIAGCARIDGPLLTRMSFYGSLETSAAAGGLLGPKAGFEVEVALNVTPSTLDFYAAGDMLMSISAVDVEVTATVHLLLDFAKLSAEGDLVGRVNCEAVLAGLSAEGQLTFHVDPMMHYLQGRMRVALCNWVVGGGLEGGFFIGAQVPKNLVWVLQTTNRHFGVAAPILPPLLTGVFGYGQLEADFNAWIFGGGIKLYAGLGAFSLAPPGLPGAFAGVVGLPYVVGACGVYVHGEILGGVVSASAWANLSLRGPFPLFFEGTVGLRGCALFVLCKSVTLTAGLNDRGVYIY